MRASPSCGRASWPGRLAPASSGERSAPSGRVVARAVLSAAAALVASIAASAQSFNVDVGNLHGVPASTYGAAAEQPGKWNLLPTGQTTPFALRTLTDGPSPVTLAKTCGCCDYEFDNPATVGGDHALMDDGIDAGNACTFTIAGLEAGTYRILTYAWASDIPTSLMSVSVPGSADPAQVVGGAWPGGQALGITYAQHRITVAAGGTVQIQASVASLFFTLNGFQIQRESCLPFSTSPEATGLAATAVGGARGDLDGDGDRDVVVTGGNAGHFVVLWNDGTGAFSSSVPIPVSGGAATAAAIGDLDGDGRNDVVVAVSDPAACAPGSAVLAFRNDGAGGFTPLAPVPTGPAPADLVLCDLDGDGDLDLVTGNSGANQGGCPDRSVSILRNGGAGGFAPAVHLPLGSRPRALALGDLDRDGDPDLVVADAGGSVQVLLGDGAGSCVPLAPIALGGTLGDVALGDLDGDGDVDAAVSVASQSRIQILLGDGAGLLTPGPAIEFAGQPSSIAVGDFDLDGRRDILYVDGYSSALVVLGNGGGASFSVCHAHPIPAPAGWLEIAEFDADGDPDLVVAFGAGQIALFRGATNLPDVFGGRYFPSGVASFADAVLAYEPLAGGGPAPVAPFAAPAAATGTPDSADSTGPRTVSLGRGGVLELAFSDNRLANSGSSADDLAVFEVGCLAERALVAVRPGNLATLERLAGIGVVPDPDGYVAAGEVAADDDGLDLDAAFPGFPAGKLHFDAVRLTDAVASGPQAGPSVGADVDAVGALRSLPPRPDLTPMSVAVPQEGFTEQSFPVTWTVRNQGDTMPGGLWQDRLYLSTDAVVGGDSVLGTFTAPSNLAPGASYLRTVQVPFPPTPGTYWIVVVTDSAGVVNEGSDEDDNARISVTPIDVLQLPKPDLQAEILAIPAVSVDSGSEITIGYRIKNLGTGSTNVPSWFDRFYLTTTNAPGSDPTTGVYLGVQSNLSYLSAGSFYDGSITLPLPHDISGTRYVVVVTDYYGQVVESIESNNNGYSAGSFTIDLEAQPDLVVEDLRFALAPPITVFSGTYLQVLWTDRNQGTGITDTTSWIDRIYLSLDANPTISAGDVLLLDHSHSGGYLNPGQGVPQSAQVLIPPATNGTRYVKVRADQNNVISEFGPGFESNNVSAGANEIHAILSVTPDLRPTAIAPTSPAPHLVGHPLSIQWSVVDDGNANWNFNFSWLDRLYLSANPTFEPGVDVQLWAAGQNAVYSGGNWIGSTYSKSATVTLPNDVAPGTWYLLVRVDADGSVFEYDANFDIEANNVLASAPFTLVLQATDLAVAADPMPNSGAAGQALPVAFHVQNVGAAVTPTSTWTDRVWLSADASLGGDQVVASVPHGVPLAAGASYAVATTGAIPTVAPGSYFLLFQADAFAQVWEAGLEANNVVAVPFTVTPEYADLTVDSFLAPTTAQGGQPLALSWQVSNSGTLPTGTSVWTDRVVLSLDAYVDPGDIVLDGRTHSGVLAPGQSYAVATSFDLPLAVSGLWYAIVVTDVHGQVFESSDANNARASRMLIDVAQAPPANLVVPSVTAAPAGTAGQPIAVSWTVRNDGIGSTSVAHWTDVLYLSLDQFADPGTDRFLGSYQHPGFLGAGEQRVVTEDFLIPSGVAGTYFVVVQTNYSNTVYEAGASSDNEGSTQALSQIGLPPVSDLQVIDVQSDATAVLGSPIGIAWTTTNAAGSTIVGQWRDSFLLSTDTQLDASDALLGQVTNNAGTLPLGSTYTQNGSFTVPGVMPGAYHVLARADALNQIPEAHEDNNVAHSVGTVVVSAIPVTPMDQSVQTMLNGQSRYYQLTAPAGLTIRVQFEHQSSTAWTELYVKRGAVPGPGDFDLAFTTPGVNSQELVIPVTDGSPYFIHARVLYGASAAVSAGTLTTEVLPFDVFAANPPVVGAGVVTVRLTGSQLHTLSAVALRRSGTSEVVPASAIAVVDAASALAAFDLGGAVLGVYDVVATASGSVTSELLGALSVEDARPPEAELSLATSPSIKKGSSGHLDARLRNTGNVNIAQTALLLGTTATGEIHVSSADLLVADLEDDGVRDTLVVLCEDLGPGQTVDVPFELAIGSQYAPSALSLGLSGRSLAPPDFATFLVDAAELLRGAVLADPASGAGLLARASTSSGWLGQIVGALPPDVSAIHVPGTPPRTGRAFLAELAAAAVDGLPAIDQVPPQALGRASADLHCALLIDSDLPCSSIAPSECGTALAEASVTIASGANVPLGVACCATPTSDDPNEKTAPVGYGVQRQVSGMRTLEYRIYFENMSTAAAPASLVRLDDVLEPTLRASSVRLQALRFGDTLLSFAPNTSTYVATLDRASTLGVRVQITAGVNASTNAVFAILQSLDPLTGEPITDGVRGFLPPNDPSGRGSGYLAFVVGTGTVATGTTVRNSATIRFDLNAGIPTNETANSFDSGNPGSNVTVAPALVSTFDYHLTWSGADDAGGSGVASYSVYASKDGGPYSPILSDSRSTSMTFAAEAGSTYRFYSLAKDNTGNTEAPPAVPDSTITVPPDCNQNHVPDALDIGQGTSQDCDADLVPDECQSDSDGDGSIDACDGCPNDPAKDDPGLCGCGVADADADSDGTPDCNDGCPTDPLKTAPGACGCGFADVDSDGDSTPDCADGCPSDPAKIAPGLCGCGVADLDADSDGTPDCIDGCPSDPLKTAPGACGCGVAETDSDGDATPDCADGCPNDPAKLAPGVCGCGIADADTDADGTPDCNDGCPTDPLKTAPGACGCGVADVDADGDATPDCVDGCPDDPAKIAPGVCGCGVSDADTDSDGTPDCADGCPNDPAKIAPGLCGCGVADADTDADGTPDCNDGCPTDPLKTAPGACGCGVADTDSDGDATPDCADGCPDDPAKIAPGLCGCGVADADADSDGTPDCNDGCPTDPLKTAPGACGCGVADVDADGDATPDCVDGCPDDPAKIAPGVCGCGVADADSDLDGSPDCVDGCPSDPAKTTPGACGCGVSDADGDLDGVPDCVDNCIAVANPTQADGDGDGHGDLCDNCASQPNPGQEDCNGNSVGDACDIAAGTSGDLNANAIPDECEQNGGTPFCFGDSGCPCGNDSAAGSGEGCRNSSGVGARLLGTGLTSVGADALVLTADQLPVASPAAFVLFFQGTANSGGVPFRDGVRCVGGNQIRLAMKPNTSGSVAYPQVGETPIAARGLVPAGGGARYYQTWYRNNLGPCGSGSNLSSGVSVVWVP